MAQSPIRRNPVSPSQLGQAYVIVADWVPRDGADAEIEAILRELAPKTRAEEGCLLFLVNRSRDKPNRLLLYEIYRSADAYAAHQQTEHFKELVLRRAVPLLATRDRRPHVVVV